MKKYLAFDSTTEELVVLGYNGKKYEKKTKICSGSEHLIKLIDEVLAKLKMDIREVEVFAGSLGPGSWTGARVGVVTLLGFLSARKEAKAVVFNSFDILSYNDSEPSDKIYIIKAFGNFVYIKINGEMKCVTYDELKSLSAGKVLVSRGKVLDGIKPQKELYIKEVVERKIENNDFASSLEIEPVYLRLSQAEYQFKEKNNKK